MFIGVYPYKNPDREDRLLILDTKDCKVEAVKTAEITPDIQRELNIKNLHMMADRTFCLLSYNVFEHIPRRPVSGMHYMNNTLSIPGMSDINLINEMANLEVNGITICDGAYMYDIFYIFKYKNLAIFRCGLHTRADYPKPFTIVVDSEGNVETYGGVKIKGVKRHKAELAQWETIGGDI